MHPLQLIVIRLVSITVHNGRVSRTSSLLRTLLDSLSNLTCRSLGSLRSLLTRSSSLLGHTLGGLCEVCLSSVLVVGRSTVSIGLVSARSFDESREVLDSAAAAVIDWTVLLASSVKFDGWETLDLVWNVIESCVDFGNGDFVGDA